MLISIRDTIFSDTISALSEFAIRYETLILQVSHTYVYAPVYICVGCCYLIVNTSYVMIAHPGQTRADELYIIAQPRPNMYTSTILIGLF